MITYLVILHNGKEREERMSVEDWYDGSEDGGSECREV